MTADDITIHHPDQLKVAFAGGVSGAITRVFVQPLDVLKIRFQLQVEPLGRKGLRSKYYTMTQAYRVILKEEGASAFWKGHTPAQLLSIGYGIAQFWAYERLKEKAKEIHIHYDHKNLSHFVCGGLAGGFATLVTTPLDVIRTRLIAQDTLKGYPNTWKAFVTIVSTEGIPGIYRGVVPGVLQVAPLMGITFMFYNFFCDITKDVLKLESKAEVPAVLNLLNGAVAGVLSKSCVYPLDLARKRLQIQGFQDHRQSFGVHFKCTGVFSCLWITIRQEGVLGLYKGITPSIWKAALTSALNFAMYDLIVRKISSIHN